MLQHSRKSSGQKEPTDMNAMSDEYLRLAYHCLKAKDKSFNTDLKTDFDAPTKLCYFRSHYSTLIQKILSINFVNF
ncbi:MAG: hypothetical protein ABI359_06555 [Ginsengibacter sp.]